MQKKWKRFWALLLCLSMLGAMAFAVHAEEPTEEPEEQVEAAAQAQAEPMEEAMEEHAEEAAEENSEGVLASAEQELSAGVAVLSLTEEQEQVSCKHEHKYWIIYPAERTHCLTCVDCKEEFSEHEPHEFVNGVCEKCGLDECAHDGARWVEAPDGHFMYCDDCGKNVLPFERHFFKNGVCERCGAKELKEESAPCEHELYYCVEYDEVNEKYYHVQKCRECGFETEPEDCVFVPFQSWQANADEHDLQCGVCHNITRTEKHSFDENQVCTVCGYKSHEHQLYYRLIVSDNPYTDEPVDNNNNFGRDCGYHLVRCSICEVDFSSYWNVESHTYENGKCTKCGYVQHQHDDHYNPNPDCIYNLRSGHVMTCSACGESVYEQHTWQNGVCTVCGHEQAHVCTTFEPCHYNQWTHAISCTECGSYSWKVMHELDRYGHCKECDYVDNTVHKHVGTEVPGYDSTCSETGLSTVYSCTCGKLFKDAACTVETEAAEVIPVKDHDWKAATCTAPMTCTACGETVGTAAAHTPGQWHQNENGHWNFCTVCEVKLAEAAHADSNEDHVCDTCGFEMPEETHVHSYRYDGKTKDKDGHTVTCSCGDSHKEAHTRNVLGRCAVCGYSMTPAAKVVETVTQTVRTVVTRLLSILFRPRG